MGIATKSNRLGRKLFLARSSECPQQSGRPATAHGTQGGRAALVEGGHTGHRGHETADQARGNLLVQIHLSRRRTKGWSAGPFTSNFGEKKLTQTHH